MSNDRRPNQPGHDRGAASRDLNEGRPNIAQELGIKARPVTLTAEDSVSKFEKESAKIPDHIPRRLPIDPSELAQHNQEQAQVREAQRTGRPLPPFLQPASSPLPELSSADKLFIQGMQELEDNGDEVDQQFHALKGRTDASAEEVDPETWARQQAELQANEGVEQELDQRHRNVGVPTGKQRAAQASAPASSEASFLPQAPLRHPIMTRMLQQFGLERLDIRYEHIAGFRFGFRKANLEDEALALRLSGMRSHSDLEFQMYKSIVLMSICVVSIDDVPVHDIFGVNLPQVVKDGITRNPSNPPAVAVNDVAPRVIMFMLEHIEPNVLDDLAKAYDEMYKAEREANRGETSRNLRETWRFECGIADCDEVQERVPKMLDTHGRYEAIFCPVHGKPMTAVSNLEDYRNNPLA